jgi:hypothetical protein
VPEVRLVARRVDAHTPVSPGGGRHPQHGQQVRIGAVMGFGFRKKRRLGTQKGPPTGEGRVRTAGVWSRLYAFAITHARPADSPAGERQRQQQVAMEMVRIWWFLVASGRRKAVPVPHGG